MSDSFSIIINTRSEDFRRLAHLYPRVLRNLPSEKVTFVSDRKILDYIKEAGLEGSVGFLDENDVLPFDQVHKVLQEHMKEILGDDELPRGATGWYYQQFLKMQYSAMCPDEFYMTWDGDTIPCAPFSMIHEESGKPYMDLKTEYHEEYFITIEKLLGLKKCIKKSFISEHMLFHTETMKELIRRIEENDAIPGTAFWEKIFHAIPPTKIANSAFAEFEAYGTYVAYTKPDMYKLREWHSFRLAGEFFDSHTISDRDFAWLAKDFQAISFEKNQFVREDNKNLFDNPEYQSKLSARKMLEIAQLEFKGGYMELWGDSDDLFYSDPLYSSSDSTGKIEMKEAELYERMGDAYLSINRNQAYLCYENAEFLSKDDLQKKTLRKKLGTLKSSGSISVAKTCIAIVSYNCKAELQQCIWSIREHCAPDAYSIVIVDNASTDGVTKWLESTSDDMTVILSDTNLGFPGGCNLCIQYAEPGQDIFLLNNDTRMTHNALFWLRMGLYSDPSIGAAGAVSSFAGNDQELDVSFPQPEEYVALGRKLNVPLANPYEEKSRLCGFAMLIRRNVLDETGGLDEAFAPGYFEDDDLSLRIRQAGYRLLVCHNSFIYHIGSKSFNENPKATDIVKRNFEYIRKKWGFECFAMAIISDAEKELLPKIEKTRKHTFRLLEIGCGSGNFLSMLKYRMPEGQYFGIEKEPFAASLGVTNLPILSMDYEAEPLPFPKGYFDRIILNTRGTAQPSEGILQAKIEPYLSKNGELSVI